MSVVCLQLLPCTTSGNALLLPDFLLIHGLLCLSPPGVFGEYCNERRMDHTWTINTSVARAPSAGARAEHTAWTINLASVCTSVAATDPRSSIYGVRTQSSYYLRCAPAKVRGYVFGPVGLSRPRIKGNEITRLDQRSKATLDHVAGRGSGFDVWGPWDQSPKKSDVMMMSYIKGSCFCHGNMKHGPI